MKKEQYLSMMETLRKNPRRKALVQRVNRGLTGLVFFCYPLYLCLLLVKKDALLLQAVAVPAVSFVVVSVFRRIVNEPRPYEKFKTPPVLSKETKGKSFPSRHVFSVFVIAVTVFVRCPAAGLLLGAAGVLLAVIRVVGGVHEPRDVIAGAVFGIASGIIGYYLIPFA